MKNNELIECLKILKKGVKATGINTTIIEGVNAGSVVWVLDEAIEEVKRHTLGCHICVNQNSKSKEVCGECEFLKGTKNE